MICLALQPKSATKWNKSKRRQKKFRAQCFPPIIFIYLKATNLKYLCALGIPYAIFWHQGKFPSTLLLYIFIIIIVIFCYFVCLSQKLRSGDSTARIWNMIDKYSERSVLQHQITETKESKDVTTLDWSVKLFLSIYLFIYWFC